MQLLKIETTARGCVGMVHILIKKDQLINLDCLKNQEF